MSSLLLFFDCFSIIKENHTIRYPAIVIIIFAALLGLSVTVYCQSADSTTGNRAHNSAIDLCPVSPLFKIYAVQYSYRMSGRSEIVLGLDYTNIYYENVGNTNAGGIILGYRHYLWNNLHVEYQLWPTWDNFYEKNEMKYYRSLDLYNEFRLGYQWDFSISDVPFYVNLQWPFGFGLYASNKPQSFKDKEKKDPFFYFPPLFFLGVRL